VFPSKSHEREFWVSNPVVLEQSNDEDEERDVEESGIQHSIGNFKMSQLYQHCLQVHRWKICQVPPRAHIELAGDKKYDVNANFLQLETEKLKPYDKSINSRESENPAMRFFYFNALIWTSSFHWRIFRRERQ
jgi:hypothetical protein